MPNVTVHLWLAERTLEAWAMAPASAPFPLEDPFLIQGFQQGALAPDLGYFPGGRPFLSDLAHCVRTGQLARAVLRNARTDLERAYAWGWVTHVLADRLLHPAVGRGVGELILGDRHRMISGDENLPAHVRVEIGLDAWVSARQPHLVRTPLSPVFHGGSVGFLARAYAETYRLAIDETLLLTGYLGTLRMGERALRSIAVLGGGRDVVDGAIGPASRTLGAVAGWLGRRQGVPGSLLLSYLSPVPPSPWLQAEVLEVARVFPRQVLEIQGDPESGLPDVNLDTGRVEGSGPPHGTRDRTLRALERLGVGFPPEGREGATGMNGEPAERLLPYPGSA